MRCICWLVIDISCIKEWGVFVDLLLMFLVLRSEVYLLNYYWWFACRHVWQRQDGRRLNCVRRIRVRLQASCRTPGVHLAGWTGSGKRGFRAWCHIQHVYRKRGWKSHLFLLSQWSWGLQLENGRRLLGRKGTNQSLSACHSFEFCPLDLING